MADIQPYTISVSDADLEDLNLRLKLAKFPHDELEGSGWDYGTPLEEVMRLTEYWKTKYDWRKAEAQLNKLPQFTTNIQCEGFESLQIHFLHQKSNTLNAIPLLFVHGWPGSFLEATKIYEKLANPDDTSAPAFNFIALSLPNYGFSTGSKKKRFGLTQYAETCHKLMLKLGYNEYVTQGGDWGYFITRALGLLYPQHCKASHINMQLGNAPKNPIEAAKALILTDFEKKGAERTKWFLEQGSGYRAEQSTKPQTIGYALADSPVALLAWIYEKLHDWTDSYPWTEDEVCTWMSIYWFSTAGPAANVRIYYEALRDESGAGVTRERLAEYIPGVKLGLSRSPKELRVISGGNARTQGDIVYEKIWESGGHFFAWEKPEHLLHDVRAMFGKDGGAYGAVEGKTGY